MSYNRKFVVSIDNNDIPTSIEETVAIRKWFDACSSSPIEGCDGDQLQEIECEMAVATEIRRSRPPAGARP